MKERSSKLERLRTRLRAVEMLRAARRFYSLRRLSEITGLDPTVLSRYSSGQTLPGDETAVRLLESLRRGIDLARIVLSNAESPGGFLDIGRPLSLHPILRLVSLELALRFTGEGVGKVLVPEASGVGLATAIATELEADLVVAQKTKGNPYGDYIEAHVAPRLNPPRIYYVRRDAIGPGDRVLVVDDIVQTGFTLAVMRKIVEAADARLVGVAAVIVVGDRWSETSGVERVESIIRIRV